MLAAIAEGHTDLADILLLVAFVLFAILAVVSVVRQTVEGALMPAGLACVALALLVL